MTKGRRICLFGGTFDPIHNAHLRIAAEAKSRFKLDEILFIPAANPPHKDASGLTSYEDRFRMVEIACEPYPGFVPSRLEEGAGHSYTISTLERFGPQMTSGDELFFLIGSDAFADLQTWNRWQDVLKLTRFIVVSRPGETYRVPPGADVIGLNGLDLPVASTTIRARVAEGKPTPELPEPVRRFIDSKGLYKLAPMNVTALQERRTDQKLQ